MSNHNKLFSSHDEYLKNHKPSASLLWKQP